MSSGNVKNEGITKPVRSSCHDLQTSMNKETGLFQPNNPQIEDPGCGLDDPSLTKDGIAGDSIGNNSPGKEEEIQSTADAEIILDEKLSEGENLQPQTIQPPPGDKAEVDDRATTKGGQIDEEGGTDKEKKSLLSGCQDSVTSINVASSGPTKLNSAFNCNENEMESSSSLLDQHEIFENEGIVQQTQVASSVDTNSSHTIPCSILLHTSTTADGGEVLNVSDHFRGKNGVYLDSLENGVKPLPTTCDDVPPSDSTTTKISSVEKDMVALHDTTKLEKTLDDKQVDVNVDKLLTSGSPQEVKDERVVLNNKEGPSEANDYNSITTYPEHTKDNDETTSRNIVNLSSCLNLTKSNDDLNSCDSTRVFKNEPIKMTLNEVEEANNTVLSTTEVGRKDIMLLEEEDRHLSEREEEVIQSSTPSVDDCSHLNTNAPVNCCSSINDESMLEGNDNKISKKEDGTMLDGQGHENDIYGGGNLRYMPLRKEEQHFHTSSSEGGSIGILNKAAAQELPNVMIGEEGSLLKPSLQLLELSKTPTSDDETTITSVSSIDIGGIDKDIHDLELFTSETEDIDDNNLLEEHDQSGVQSGGVVASSHSLSSPHRSEEQHHHHCRTTIKKPVLTLEDVFQTTSTVTTPQCINDLSPSDKLMLTPRSAKACAMNGVNPVLLLKRNMESFGGPDVDPSIQKLKCEMYNRRRYQLMKICCNEKGRLDDEETAQANAMLHHGGGGKGQPKSQQQCLQNGKNNMLSMIEHEKQKVENIKRQRLSEAEQQLALEMKQKEMEEKIRAREEKEELAATKLVREKKRRQREIAEERRMREIRKKAEVKMETTQQQILLHEEREKSFRLAQAKLKEEKKAKEEARHREQKAMESRKQFKMQTQLLFEQNQRKALVAEVERKEKEELRKKRVDKQHKAALDAISANRNQRKKRIEMNVKHNEVSARIAVMRGLGLVLDICIIHSVELIYYRSKLLS